jgi:hypothetical protein
MHHSFKSFVQTRAEALGISPLRYARNEEAEYGGERDLSGEDGNAVEVNNLVELADSSLNSQED